MSIKSTILALILVFCSAVFAGQGGESGGGEDAVVIDEKIIIRDALVSSETKKVDSIEFLKTIPDFDNLIQEIAEAHPIFALQILNQLLSAKIYLSKTPLQTIPEARTTSVGKSGHIQIAVRWADEILISPAFFKSSEQSYILVHEAIHGLLLTASGPFHHNHVRSITHYLIKNRGHYTKKSIKEVLNHHRYNNQNSITEIAASVVLNKTVPREVQCFAEQMLADNFSDGEKTLIAQYQGFTCSFYHDSDYHEIENFIREYNGLENITTGLLKASYLHSIDHYGFKQEYKLQPFLLPKTSSYKFFQRQKQKAYCKNQATLLQEIKGTYEAEKQYIEIVLNFKKALGPFIHSKELKDYQQTIWQGRSQIVPDGFLIEELEGYHKRFWGHWALVTYRNLSIRQAEWGHDRWHLNALEAKNLYEKNIKTGEEIQTKCEKEFSFSMNYPFFVR